MTPHSPTPWTKHPDWANRLLDASGNWTACEVPGSYNSPSVIADADYILLCVNAHEALVEALIECRHAAAAMMRFVADQNNPHDGFTEYMHTQGVKDGFGKRVENVLSSVGIDFAYLKDR